MDDMQDQWGTTRDRWTIRGVYFDTAGWQLTDATETSMSWAGRFGGTMTLANDKTSGPSQTSDLDTARREHRERAAQTRGGLVSVEVVEMADGSVALEAITKHRRGVGFGFEGHLFIDEGADKYTLRVAIDETTTGVRESIVSGLRIQLGEIDLLALMSGPAGPDGGRVIPGMQLDPYDSAHDAQATYSASDDPRIDELLQTHPLAVIRSTFRRAQATWESAASDGRVQRMRQALPFSAGPKVVLSDRVVRELYRIANGA